MASPSRAAASSDDSQLQQSEQPSIEYFNEETVEVRYRGSIDAYLRSLPAGFRFAPRDDELLDDYLKRKDLSLRIPLNFIKEINIYKYNPSELAVEHKPLDENDKAWYFFTPRDRKYPNGSRPDRAAGNGYWKATGADRDIKQLGTRKALVFYEGKPPTGTKTNWIMHEYKLNNATPPTRVDKDDKKLDNHTLVKIYEKTDRVLKANGNTVMRQNNEVIFNKEPTPEIVENDISPKSNHSDDLFEQESGGSKEIIEAINGENAVGGVSRHQFSPSWNDTSSGSEQFVAPMPQVENNNYIRSPLDAVTVNGYQHHVGSPYHSESWPEAPCSNDIGQFDMKNDDLSIANYYQHQIGSPYHLELSHETPSSYFSSQTGFDVNNYQGHTGSTYHMESLHQVPSSNIIRNNSFEDNYMSINSGRFSQGGNDDSYVDFWLVDHPPSLPLSPSLPLTFPPPLPMSLPPSEPSLTPNQ